MSDFLRLVLQRVSFAQMANSLNISKSPSRGLLEAHYQNEFYRYSGCLVYIVPLDCNASIACIAMQGLQVAVASWSTPFTRRRTSVWCSRPNRLYASAVEVGV